MRLVERFINDREEACEALAASIAEYEVDGLSFRYTYCGGGDGMLFISGGASFGVTDTDPLALDLPVLRPQVRDDHAADPLAGRTAVALEQYLSWAHEQLRAHPASTADSGANPIKRADHEMGGSQTIARAVRGEMGHARCEPTGRGSRVGDHDGDGFPHGGDSWPRAGSRPAHTTGRGANALRRGVRVHSLAHEISRSDVARQRAGALSRCDRGIGPGDGVVLGGAWPTIRIW